MRPITLDGAISTMVSLRCIHRRGLRRRGEIFYARCCCSRHGWGPEFMKQPSLLACSPVKCPGGPKGRERLAAVQQLAATLWRVGQYMKIDVLEPGSGLLKAVPAERDTATEGPGALT